MVPLFLELVVNFIGVLVALDGLKGSHTLSLEAIRRYCYGLVFVGCFEIGMESKCAQCHSHTVHCIHTDVLSPYHPNQPRRTHVYLRHERTLCFLVVPIKLRT